MMRALGWAANCCFHVLVQVAFRSGSRYDHARRCGDHQGGYLRDQPVTHRSDGVDAEHLGKLHAPLDHTNDGASYEIHHSNDDSCNGIALNQLGSTVHGPEKLSFSLDGLSPFLCLILADKSGAEVGVDGHLLAGHGVQGEPGGYFGYTFGSLRDDDELNHEYDDEYYKSNHGVAAEYEGSEGFNDLPRLAPVAQNQSG
jgi:hypothetical protein